MRVVQESLAALVENSKTPAKKVEAEARKSALRPAPLPGLDPAVVLSAREAGIPEDQLRRLSGLLAKGNKMEDAPRPKKAAERTSARNPLSESEAEPAFEDLEEDAAGETSGAPVEQALVQLTKIVGSLAKDKEKKTKDLEALLDGVEPEGESSTTSTGKGKAAVYKRLKACLQSDPVFIYETVE